MERLLNIKVYLLLLFFFSGFSFAAYQSGQKDNLEKSLISAIKKEIRCKDLKVKSIVDKTNPNKISNLLIRFEEVEIGGITADYITVQMESPVIDAQNLKKNNRLKFLSYTNQKVNILLSASSLQNYLNLKAKEFGKNNVSIKLKFSAPYIECFYEVPTKEITSETLGIIKKFIPGDKLDGYAAFTLEIKKNELSAHSSKVILNHFLLPSSILNIFENKFNPFDKITPLKLFDFQINNVVVQSKYLMLSK